MADNHFMYIYIYFCFWMTSVGYSVQLHKVKEYKDAWVVDVLPSPKFGRNTVVSCTFLLFLTRISNHIMTIELSNAIH